MAIALPQVNARPAPTTYRATPRRLPFPLFASLLLSLLLRLLTLLSPVLFVFFVCVVCACVPVCRVIRPVRLPD